MFYWNLWSLTSLSRVLTLELGDPLPPLTANRQCLPPSSCVLSSRRERRHDPARTHPPAAQPGLHGLLRPTARFAANIPPKSK